MVKLTTEDLKERLSELQNKRVELAYRITGDLGREAITQLAEVQSAIKAIEDVISAGSDDPRGEHDPVGDMKIWSVGGA